MPGYNHNKKIKEFTGMKSSSSNSSSSRSSSKFRPGTKDELKKAISNYQEEKSSGSSRKRKRDQPNDWDTSLITDMSELFKGNEEFNEPINNWDTSNVTNMSSMFEGASSFNQPIGKWNTSQVTDMSSMFEGASKFNQPIDNYRGVPKCRHNTEIELRKLRRLIRLPGTVILKKIAKILHGDRIDGFDTSQVTNMRSMFKGAKSFNQPVGQWDTSRVTDMYMMFFNATNFNQDIERWNTGQVTDMKKMLLTTPNDEDSNQILPSWYDIDEEEGYDSEFEEISTCQYCNGPVGRNAQHVCSWDY